MSEAINKDAAARMAASHQTASPSGLRMVISTLCMSCGQNESKRSVSRSLLTVMIWSAIAFVSMPSTAIIASQE